MQIYLTLTNIMFKYCHALDKKNVDVLYSEDGNVYGLKNNTATMFFFKKKLFYFIHLVCTVQNRITIMQIIIRDDCFVVEILESECLFVLSVALRKGLKLAVFIEFCPINCSPKLSHRGKQGS